MWPRSSARPSTDAPRATMVNRFSQRARKRIEEVFGWLKTVGGGRKLRYRGIARNRLWAEMTIAGYNLVRLANLTAATA